MRHPAHIEKSSHPPMRYRILALVSVALTGATSVPSLVAQNQTKQQQQQARRDLRAQQKAEEDADKRQRLLEEVQPEADEQAEGE